MTERAPRAREVAVAVRVVATLVEARIPLVEALEAGARQSAGRLRRALTSVAGRVRRGAALSAAFRAADAAERRPVFGPLFVTVARVGEAGGALGPALSRLATELERRDALARRVRMAAAYPAVVLLIAAGATAFLLAFVVPTFEALFAEFDAALPAPTRAVLWASSALRESTPYVVVVALLFAAAGRWATTKSSVAARAHWLWEGALLQLPVLGRLSRSARAARFSRALGTLVSAGVPLADALDAAGAATGSPRGVVGARAARRALERGARPAAALQTGSNRAGGLLPPAAMALVEAGDRSGTLGDMLERAALHEESEAEGLADTLAGVLEPVLIAVVGILVGALLVALYLPMFELATVIE